MVYDTEDPTLIAQMNAVMSAIESTVIVGVLKYTAARSLALNDRSPARAAAN